MGKDISKHFATTGKRQLKPNIQMSLETWSSVQMIFCASQFFSKKYKLTKHNERKQKIWSILIFCISNLVAKAPGLSLGKKFSNLLSYRETKSVTT